MSQKKAAEIQDELNRFTPAARDALLGTAMAALIEQYNLLQADVAAGNTGVDMTSKPLPLLGDFASYVPGPAT